MKQRLAKGDVLIDNTDVRVVRWTFAPGEETGYHVHHMRYVVVPMTSGQLLIETDRDSLKVELDAGVPYARDRGVAHNVVNAGLAEVVFIEIEIKDRE